MAGKSTTRFEVPCFNGTDFALWKMKMQAVLVKDGCAFALKEKENKPDDCNGETAEDQTHVFEHDEEATNQQVESAEIDIDMYIWRFRSLCYDRSSGVVLQRVRSTVAGTTGKGGEGILVIYIAEDLNKGKLDYFYFLLPGLGMVINVLHLFPCLCKVMVKINLFFLFIYL
ncbi:hypothetical protein Taro_018594 [Colocasia esculenta]|uniref:Uncharacterized protein n=1 Tax=Colocasia esculenta TaxID=4460 RepID=A0A843UZK6_COLES|nr:hypothetical protein [Colocasia esculenta]